MVRSHRLSRLTRVVTGLAAGVAIAAAPWSSPRAQGRAPIAIVNARLVDGSGNEPFTGTIVFAAGRIVAVGRQVDVPADAQTIDATGKTVLPGAIDAGLGGALAGDTGRRRLGRALAAGVTTAATIDAPPAVPADPIAPRLLAQPRDAEATSSAAPGARPLRNGTIAITLEGDARAAAGAARAAKARVALAGLAGGDGTIDPARLAATGLAPLEVVTAMSSGGAWALGLQSDRGLLAPGMRADLVVVTGDPTASLDALTAVERVYLGGVEVDRAALLRVPEPAIAPPASTPPPAAPASPPAITTAGRISTPAPLRARGRAPKNARLQPVVASRPALGPVPAPGSFEPAAGAAPSPTAPVPAPAAAAPAAAAPYVGERLREALLDDFERGDTVSAVGPPWTGSGNDAATTIIMGRVVKGLRDHALMVSARMGTAREPFARVALKLDAGERPVDVSRFRGLRFDARGEGRYRVVFVTRTVADGRYHESYFSGSPLWTPVNIPFASVGQTGPGEHVAWTGRDLVEIRFEIARDAGRLGWLELDNVTFY